MVPKVIRDPVHDYIPIDRDKGGVFLSLIGTAEFQRLRRIHQLGVSQFTYPGAVHCRLSHSLGVHHLARLALEYVKQQYPGELDDEIAVAALCWALLHDVGHGPYSHLLESQFGGDHEILTRRIIMEDTEVNAVLRKHSANLPGLIVALAEKGDRDNLWLSALISSQLDVDRIDYLMRDAHFTGVQYGHFDHYRLIHTFELRKCGQKFLQPVWQAKAGHAIEEYLFARYFMYRSVYFHHTTRGFEQMLRAIIRRAGQLQREASTFAPECLGAMQKMLLGKADDLQAFLCLDDSVVQAHISHWRLSKDPILSDLCRRFCNRKRFSAISVGRQQNPLTIANKINEARKYLADHEVDPEFYLYCDTIGTSVYDYYHPEEAPDETSAINSILLVDGKGKPKEISRVADHIKSVTGRLDQSGVTHKYYCHPDHAKKVEEILA